MGHSVLKTLQKMDHQGTSVPSSPSSLRLSEGSSSSFSEHQTITKPLWAPLETDAPITLASDTNDEVHVCQLCGCWYETQKGLSSHAHAHFCQIRIPDSALKGNHIEFLSETIEEDPKLISTKQQDELTGNGSLRGSSKCSTNFSSPLASPASKRKKTLKECTCVLCGKQFENPNVLASHAHIHLCHIGMNDLVGKSCAIDTVQELVRSGMLEAVQHSKPNSDTVIKSLAPTSHAVSAVALFSNHSWTSSRSLSQMKNSQSPQGPLKRAPKAKKGFWLAVDPLHRTPKPEPAETEVYMQPKAPGVTSNSLIEKQTAAVSTKLLYSDIPSPPTVLCDFCGQLFETRKALSCHARAHLRQLGLTWSVRTSPIDLLKEVILHGEERKEVTHSGSAASGKTLWTSQGFKRSRANLPTREAASNSWSSTVDYSMRKNYPSVKTGLTHGDTTCELCGFDFENRKALASHARAHLRQLGIFEWKADGATSPIELLSELIQKDQAKVAEITRRYHFGDLYVKKSQKTPASSPLSTDSVPSSNLKLFLMQQKHRVTKKNHNSVSVRATRGIQPSKHEASSGEDSHNTNVLQLSRSGSIPSLLPKPPLTSLVKLVGNIYSLKCRFCEEVFHGPLSVQEQWITHLQKHILSLGYKGKEAPPVTSVCPALVHHVAH